MVSCAGLLGRAERPGPRPGAIKEANMFRSYLTAAWRNLWRHKGHSLLNLAGFALGMACCAVILVSVRHEHSFDNYHKDVDRVFRISLDIRTKTSNRVFAPISDTAGPALKADYPQVEAAARVWPWSHRLVKRESLSSYEDLVMFADASLFDVLTIPLKRGDPRTALVRPSTAVLSESMARKYFGDADPVGAVLETDLGKYEVTAVAADPPANTHLKYGLITSMATIEKRNWMNNWHSTMFYTYLKLKPGVDVAGFSKLIEHLADRYVKAQLDAWGNEYRYFLQPVRGLHLASPLRGEIEPPASAASLSILLVVGLFTLLIACLNFMNLATARAANRAREVGLRKVVGADKRQLVGQFLGESLLLAFISMALAVFIVGLGLRLLSAWTGAGLRVSWLFSAPVVILLAAVAVLVGLGAGVYPAFILSSFRPVAALQGALGRGRSGRAMRRLLVVVQFSISSALILGTLFMNQQVRFMKHATLGFDKEQKLVVPVRGVSRETYASVRGAFLGGDAAVRGAALSSAIPGRPVDNYAIKIVGEADDKNQSMFHLYFDESFIPLYGIGMVAGRAFEKDMPTDIAGAFLINEAAVKAFGWKTPEEALGKRLQTGNGGRVLTIIGVTRDFHYRGLQAPVEPLAMEFNPGMLGSLTLEIDTTDVRSVLAFVEKRWKEIFPGRPFESFFLDDDFNRQYEADERVGRIFGLFMVLGLAIACMGLFGLASFTAASRTREIGIRKILGASTSRIAALLAGQFALWVLVGNLLAWPAAYLFVGRWLKGYASRITPGPIMFVLSAAAVLALALLTTSAQTIRAASANPADSLRHE
jgi:putative ABC transport system permease protein